MPMIRIGLLFCGLTLLAETRELVQYPAQVVMGQRTLAAEFLVHSIPASQGIFVAENYLVIDAALFGQGSTRLSASQFTLRVNGKKAVLYPQTPGVVAASIKDPAWAGQRPQTTVSGGVGNAGVTLGGPPRVERFPGDPTARRTTPSGTTPRIETVPDVSMEDQIELASFPEGDRKLPAGGALYFGYRGKIASLELVYEGPAGHAELKLR